MTTAQDQQSRSELLPCPFCGDKPAVIPSHDADGCFWSWVQCGQCGARTQGAWVSNRADTCPIFYEGVREEWNQRALPAPENVREGEPYDNPAFEDLARTMGVWGTAQSALCAQFFLAGRGALPAGMTPAHTQRHEDICGNEVGPPDFFYSAAQVQAMGRVPPGWQAVPVVPTEEMREAGYDAYGVDGCYQSMLAAAPRPPAAQEATQ